MDDREKHLEELAAATHTIGEWHDEILPDGSHTMVRYKGVLAKGQYPPHLDLGDEYFYKGNFWIWMIPAGKTAPEWVDP